MELVVKKCVLEIHSRLSVLALAIVVLLLRLAIDTFNDMLQVP